MRKGESHDSPFPDLTIKQLYYSVNAFTIIRCYGRLIKSGGNDNCFELNNSFIDYSESAFLENTMERNDAGTVKVLPAESGCLTFPYSK